MVVIGAIRRRLRLLARSEQGMALPTAIFAMIASFGFATAAVLSSLDAQQGAHRDSDSKSAIAAADAGANIALMRLNRFHDSLSSSYPCVGPSGEKLPQEGNGWCAPTSAESVGSATFSYQVSAFKPNSELSVVSKGSANAVSRRVDVGLASYEGEEVFANEKFIGQENIKYGGKSKIRTDLGTNGNVERVGDEATVCGDIRHGVGYSAPTPNCGGEVTEGYKSLPPVNPPEGIAKNNSNCRLEVSPTNKKQSTCAIPSELDTFTKPRSSTEPWDPVTRTIKVSKESTLTMGGRDYFVCRLVVQGSGTLIMAAGDDVRVRIFFDTPENCGLSAGATQVQITGGGKVQSTGYNPSAGEYNLPELYLLGSTAIPTTVELSGESGTNELIIYAPYSDIHITGSSSLIGMAAGRTLTIDGEPTIKTDVEITKPAVFYSTLWQRTRYVECAGASGSSPDANC